MCAALSDPNIQKILLIGMPGVGKSSVGLLVARKLQWDFVDIDGKIEQEAGISIAEMFASPSYGEARFRYLEREMIAELMGLPGSLVCATGGGAVESENVRELLRAPEVLAVWLLADLDVLLTRAEESNDRPLLLPDPRRAMETLLDRRMPLYRSIADVTIDTGTVGIEEAADSVIYAFSQYRPSYAPGHFC